MSYIVPGKMPESCHYCQFGRVKWSYPCWYQGKNKNKKGIYCELDSRKRILKLSIDDTTTKAEWCPLVEVEGR